MGYARACAPYLFIIIVQLAYGASNILCKLALQKGLSYLVLIVYRHLIAMFIFGPLAYIFERKQGCQLTRPILAKIFFLSLLGTTIHQNVYYAGLDYTSPTVACSLSSVIPALTFVLAVLLRMEKVRIDAAKGRAKLLGTCLSIGGVLLFTFWKGYLFKSIVRRPMIVMNRKGAGHGLGHGEENWLKGSALIFASYVAYSAWLILQALVCEVYPAKLSMNTLICFFASVQSSVLALIFERSSSSWRLEWNIQLLTILYCGTAISGLVYYLQTWCVNEKGPVFAAMFTPLLLVVVAIFSAFLFAERLHLGRIVSSLIGQADWITVVSICNMQTWCHRVPLTFGRCLINNALRAASLGGALFIVVGLYLVLWGKSNNSDEKRKEESPNDEVVRSPAPSNQMTLIISR